MAPIAAQDHGVIASYYGATLADEPALAHTQVVRLTSQRTIGTWLAQHAA